METTRPVLARQHTGERMESPARREHSLSSAFNLISFINEGLSGKKESPPVEMDLTSPVIRALSAGLMKTRVKYYAYSR
jgi:hypothetical protein